MSSRDAIVSRIRTHLAHDPPRSEPPAPEVWPREDPSRERLAARFTQELEAVHGEVIRSATMAEAAKQLADLMAQQQWALLGAMDRPLCRELTAGFEPSRVSWAQRDWTPQSMADLPVGLVEADCLLADTGTVMVACPHAEERLLCYLPLACVAVATVDRLAEHLPAAWSEIAPRVADPEARGELVFITGPSRTADIEKILILGVHGPKRLVVLLVG